jgi:hypothetical protein
MRLPALFITNSHTKIVDQYEICRIFLPFWTKIIENGNTVWRLETSNTWRISITNGKRYLGGDVTSYESESNQIQMDFFNKERIQRNPTIRRKAEKVHTQNKGKDYEETYAPIVKS